MRGPMAAKTIRTTMTISPTSAPRFFFNRIHEPLQKPTGGPEIRSLSCQLDSRGSKRSGVSLGRISTRFLLLCAGDAYPGVDQPVQDVLDQERQYEQYGEKDGRTHDHGVVAHHYRAHELLANAGHREDLLYDQRARNYEDGERKQNGDQ